MTQQIKPKQCGETTRYIPNQKGFVPSFLGRYWFCGAYYGAYGNAYQTVLGSPYDYAMIDSGNCFETEQEAIEALVKPADPTPLTWDGLCEIADIGEDAMVAMVNCFKKNSGEWVNSYKLRCAGTVRRMGRLNFSVNKYWRDTDALEAWIEQQKGE